MLTLKKFRAFSGLERGEIFVAMLLILCWFLQPFTPDTVDDLLSLVWRIAALGTLITWVLAFRRRTLAEQERMETILRSVTTRQSEIKSRDKIGGA